MTAYRANSFVHKKTKWDFTPRKTTLLSWWRCHVLKRHTWIYTTVWIRYCPNFHLAMNEIIHMNDPSHLIERDHDRDENHLHAFFACGYCLKPAISYLSKDYEEQMDLAGGRILETDWSMPGGFMHYLTHDEIINDSTYVLLDTMEEFHEHVRAALREADYFQKER